MPEMSLIKPTRRRWPGRRHDRRPGRQARRWPRRGPATPARLFANSGLLDWSGYDTAEPPRAAWVVRPGSW